MKSRFLRLRCHIRIISHVRVISHIGLRLHGLLCKCRCSLLNRLLCKSGCLLNRLLCKSGCRLNRLLYRLNGLLRVHVRIHIISIHTCTLLLRLIYVLSVPKNHKKLHINHTIKAGFSQGKTHFFLTVRYTNLPRLFCTDLYTSEW